MAGNGLLAAAAIASGNNISMEVAVGKKSLDSNTNAIKIMNLIAKVYSKCAEHFVGLDMIKHEDKIKELMLNGTALSVVARKGIVNDADAVSVLEALKWTSAVVLSEGASKPRIRLALIAPSEDKDEKNGFNAELAAKTNPSIWNSFILESYDIKNEEYHEVYDIMQAGPKYVHIYNLSTNLYDVTLG